MKKLIILILSFAALVSVYSQVYEDWSAPVALTDTNSFNSNPVITTIPEYGMGDVFMFYEKTQTLGYNSTIWWKKISEPQGEEEMLIGGYLLDYRNPQIAYNDYIIFEMNVNDIYNLYAAKVDENGLVPGESYQLTYTETDDTSFYASSANWPIGCWINEGKVMVAEIELNADSLFFSNIEVLDSGDCFDPVCKENYVAWRKLENNESHIYYSEK
ncbi:MAG: hypothetical protein K8S16_09935, partial [Bacteroidales bacterium]|nr:hypothetical protein [Bacteroidales bacterium]